MLEKTIFSTNAQKILAFLIRNPDQEYFDRQISKLAGLSKAGTNLALRDLAKEGLVSREKRGRMYFYRALSDNFVIQYLKIIQNLIYINPLVEKLKRHALKVILYGSSAYGRNNVDSDVDIFILSREPAEVKEIIFKSKLRNKIRHVVHTPTGYINSKTNNPVFHSEVEKGIVLWDQKSV